MRKRRWICLFLMVISTLTMAQTVTEDMNRLLPAPVAIQVYQNKRIRLHADTGIYLEAPDSVKSLFRDYLKECQGVIGFSEKKPTVRYYYSERYRKGMVSLQLVDTLKGMKHPEGYLLEIKSLKRMQIKAVTPAGLFYGLQTLVQLVDQSTGSIPAVRIEDYPYLNYRGMMLDVSRHFFDKEFIKKQMDWMAAFKMNRLHLHLTDAAGWRLEIKHYPELTRRAAWRPQARWKDWWQKDRAYAEEGMPGAYGGYYRQEDIRELVRYARNRHITIIPEIEMPSHSEEVLTVYPELSCTHEPYKQSDFCVGNEQTFVFLQQVLDEVMALFPSEYIHVGGDEAPKTSWKTCPLCQQRMQQEGLKDVSELQSYLIRRIEKYLNSKGRKLIGWDEILEGGLPPRATVMSWRGTEGGLAAVRSGHHAIMSPGAYCYLDAYQDAPHTQPEAIGGYLPLEKVYAYDPIPDSLSVSECRLIDGVQANLWTEYIPDEQHAEYMLYPRMLALAETAWSRPEKKSWQRFHHQALSVVAAMKRVGYHPFDLSREVGNRPESKDTLRHLAYGKHVVYQAPYWGSYPASGKNALTDGLRGGWNYNDGLWQGFVSQKRLDVVIDLKDVQEVHQIYADFMQICGPEVFMPARVMVSVSTDGEHFSLLGEERHQVVRDDAVSFKRMGWKGQVKARYIRYQALADEKIGGVVFTDEIVVE